MNLNQNPTVQQLAQLYAACDDRADFHVVYVTKSGDVKVEVMPEGEDWDSWELARNVKLRRETFNAGNGYVGVAASKDLEYMRDELAFLVGHWKLGTSGYVDYPPRG